MPSNFRPTIFVSGSKIKLVAFTSTKSKVVTSLVGYKAGKYLLTEQPKVNGIPTRLEEGTNWAANFVFEGDIIGFTTQVLGSCRIPVPLTFLSYPDSVEFTRLRQGKRYPVQINGHITIRNGPEDSTTEPAQMVIRDISLGGCQMGTKIDLNPGDVVQLSMNLPNGKNIESLEAEVKTSRNVGGYYLFGLSFNVGRASNGYRDIIEFVDGLEGAGFRL